MRFTKQNVAMIHAAEWRNALHDGRVVRFNSNRQFRSFKTVDEAEAYRLALHDDMAAVRLTVNQNVTED
jgi:hypothetical protein